MIDIKQFEPNDEFFRALREGKVNLFIGAGFSKGIKNMTSEFDLPEEWNIPNELHETIPLSREFKAITNQIFKKSLDFEIDTIEAAADMWKNKYYKNDAFDLTNFFKNLFIVDEHEFLSNKYQLYKSILLPSWNGIYTLNFDNVIQTIIKLSHLENNFIEYWYPKNKGVIPRENRIHLVHLHGSILKCQPNELVFSSEGYDSLNKSRHQLYDALHTEAEAERWLVIIGTQFDEDAIKKNFFDQIKTEKLKIYHFDQQNKNIAVWPVIFNKEIDYTFIKINSVEEVLDFFEKNTNKLSFFDPNSYLTKIVNDDNLTKLNKLYINLLGQESDKLIDMNSTGIELTNEDLESSISMAKSLSILGFK